MASPPPSFGIVSFPVLHSFVISPVDHEVTEWQKLDTVHSGNKKESVCTVIILLLAHDVVMRRTEARHITCNEKLLPELFTKHSKSPIVRELLIFGVFFTHLFLREFNFSRIIFARKN